MVKLPTQGIIVTYKWLKETRSITERIFMGREDESLKVKSEKDEMLLKLKTNNQKPTE